MERWLLVGLNVIQNQSIGTGLTLKELCHEVCQNSNDGTVAKLSETKITAQDMKRRYN